MSGIREQGGLRDMGTCGSGIQGRCGLEVHIRDASLLPAQLYHPPYRITEDSAVTTFEALKARVRELERQLSRGDRYKCLICMVRGREPHVSLLGPQCSLGVGEGLCPVSWALQRVGRLRVTPPFSAHLLPRTHTRCP